MPFVGDGEADVLGCCMRAACLYMLLVPSDVVPEECSCGHGYLVGVLRRNDCVAAVSDVSSWVCDTCQRHLLRGKIPPVCHLNYGPFRELPEELQDLSAVENDLIALRIPFMKLRALASSVKGGAAPFGQLCLSGMVINVPTALARIQVELPR